MIHLNNSGNEETRKRSLGDYLFPIAATTVIMTIVAGLYWLVFGYWNDASSRQWKWLTQVVIERRFVPGGFFSFNSWTDWAYLFTAIFVGIGAAAAFSNKAHVAVRSGLTGMCVVLGITSVLTWAHDLNDHSAAYADSTYFIVKDISQMPDSLKRLDKEATGHSEKCDKLANRDMQGCILEGEFVYTWEARTASYVGAEKRISKAGTSNNKTQLLSETLTYTYGDEGEGAWTAIRDGMSKEPIYGVITYDGVSDPTVCKFDGDNEMNKAFGGTWGTNLSDEIAGKYPNLFYDQGDRWGYCDGDKPVIVIPMKEQVSFRHRTAFRAAGVLVITGSPSGDAQYQRISDVQPGDFPGPVYPASLAREQRESMGMIAGIRNSWFGSFGYEPVSEASQSGNSSEYLLRNTIGKGGTFWVTPLKQRDSDNQRIVAYAVVSADVATSGSLNALSVYVLNNDDPQAASISDMEASVKDALNVKRASFLGEGTDGYLAEFLPLDAKTWQVYAEINGRVVYRIVVPVDTDVRPTIYTIDAASEEEPGSPDAPKSSCVEDLKSLDDQQLVKCLGDLSEELESRNVS